MSKLRTIPGPLLASMTNLWRLIDVLQGQHHDTLIRLHREHKSKLIRIGPNTVSVADPEAVKVIYGLNKGFQKVIIMIFTLCPCTKSDDVLH